MLHLVVSVFFIVACRVECWNPSNFTFNPGSINNSYVQNGQVTIVALKEGLTAAMLTSKSLQEFTFGTFAAKIRLPYGQGMWPAY